MPPEEKREWKGVNEVENNILAEHTYNKGSNGVVGKPTTKRIILIWSYEIHLKIMR